MSFCDIIIRLERILKYMGTIEIITALAKIFVIILPGFFLKRKGILTKEHTQGFTSLLANLTYPCLVISAMQMEFSMEILNNCKYVVLIFMGVIFISIFLSKILMKILKLPATRSGLFAFMMVFGNTGFVGLPVLNGLLGPEAVFYGALCDASYDVFMFTMGIALIQGAAKGEEKRPIKEILKGILNPCFFGVIIGLVLYITGTVLPEIIAEPVKSIGSVTSPLAMMIVGSHLAEIKFKELFTDKLAYLVCFLKLMVTPTIALILVSTFLGTGSLLASVLILQSAMPIAMSSVIFSGQYKADVAFTTKTVLMSTVLCIATTPLFAILLQYI
jgi:predicted permease